MKRPNRRWLAAFRTLIGIGLIAYLVAAGAIDWSSIADLFRVWRPTLLAFGLLSLVVTLVSLRLRILMAAQAMELPLGPALRLTLIGGFFDAFLPGSNGGDVARVVLAVRSNPGIRSRIAAVIIVDRVVGAFSLLALPLLVVIAIVPFGVARPPILDGLLLIAALGAIVLAATLVLGTRDGTRPIIVGAFDRVRLGAQAATFLDTIEGFSGRTAAVLYAFLISLVVQGLVVAALMLLAVATSGTGFTWGLIMVIPFGMFANALPVTPGGIGVGEAAFAALFATMGATGGAAALIGWRVLTTMFDLIGGVLFAIGRTRIDIDSAQTARVEAEVRRTVPRTV